MQAARGPSSLQGTATLCRSCADMTPRDERLPGGRLVAAMALRPASGRFSPTGDTCCMMEEMPGLRRRENVMIAAVDTGLVPMRVSKAVGLMDGDDLSAYMVLDELDGDRHLVISVGDAEAFALDAGLQGLQWGRPMTYEFTAALVRSLAGRLREVRLDRIVEGAYAATVEVEGPQGVGLVDARSSDALNLAVLTDAPVFVSPDMLADCIGRQEADSAEAALLQRAIAAGPMAVRRADR